MRIGVGNEVLRCERALELPRRESVEAETVEYLGTLEGTRFLPTDGLTQRSVFLQRIKNKRNEPFQRR